MNIDKYNINIYGRLTLFGVIIDFFIAVIIIIVICLVSFPKYQALQIKASQAAVASLAGALSSASAINYIEHLSNSPDWRNVNTCIDAANNLPGGLPVGYQIVGANTKQTIANGAYITCTIEGPTPSQTQSTFVAIGAS